MLYVNPTCPPANYQVDIVLNPLVPDAHYSERRNIQFPLQNFIYLHTIFFIYIQFPLQNFIYFINLRINVKLRIFICWTLGTDGLTAQTGLKISSPPQKKQWLRTQTELLYAFVLPNLFAVCRQSSPMNLKRRVCMSVANVCTLLVRRAKIILRARPECAKTRHCAQTKGPSFFLPRVHNESVIYLALIRSPPLGLTHPPR